MVNVSRRHKELLRHHFLLTAPSVSSDHCSQDGTRKWGLKMNDSALIETVFIPDADRGSVCVSSQAGCPVRCSFCATGAMGAGRNLTAGEIVQQLLVAQRAVGDIGRRRGLRAISNVVFMVRSH